MKKVKTAIIACAGRGARFKPLTYVIPKQMLPIKNRPALHWLIDECKEAGIKKVIIVINYNEKLIPRYFQHVEFKKIKIEFVRQPNDISYGNAAPLLMLKDKIKDDYFAYFYGDDIVWPIQMGLPEMVNKFPTMDCEMLLAVERIPLHEAKKYGIVYRYKGTSLVKYIVEKPDILKATEAVASIGRFIFSKEFLKYIDGKLVTGSNELWLVNFINKATHKLRTESISLWGKWLTISDPKTYLKLLNHIENETS